MRSLRTLFQVAFLFGDGEVIKGFPEPVYGFINCQEVVVGPVSDVGLLLFLPELLKERTKNSDDG